jgi:uncharacterized protein (TIGR01777 family)
MRVLVTGGTGLLGRALSEALRGAGHDVTVTSRTAGPGRVVWDPAVGPPPVDALEGLDAVVHLLGEPVADRRWNDAQKALIRDSRWLSTRRLVEALGRTTRRPGVLVCASAVGIYGERGEERLTEDSAPGTDFLAEVCVGWEREAAGADALGMRRVSTRIGVVLATGGGALPKMLLPFRLGVGGKLGSGRQHFPWVHLADTVGLLTWAVENTAVRGPVNVVAPGAVTNAQFTRALGKVLHRPTVFTVPDVALRLALGEATTALLASQNVTPAVAERLGYAFRFPEVEGALSNLLRP